MVDVLRTTPSHGGIAAGVVLAQLLSTSPVPAKSWQLRTNDRLVALSGASVTEANRRLTIATGALRGNPIAGFYADLASNQESLGRDLERALAERAWDLYAR